MYWVFILILNQNFKKGFEPPELKRKKKDGANFFSEEKKLYDGGWFYFEIGAVKRNGGSGPLRHKRERGVQRKEKPVRADHQEATKKEAHFFPEAPKGFSCSRLLPTGGVG